MNDPAEHTAARWALDIGSTVVKLARLDGDGGLESQEFFPRDFDAGIAGQVNRLLQARGIDVTRVPVLGCSSANGGLRVGIVCLSKHFSGAAMRNQVLLAGANPVFVHDFEEARGDDRQVDLLLVGGGIDQDDGEPMRRRLAGFDPAPYRYSAIAYCGNARLAQPLRDRIAALQVIDNPLGETLSSKVGSVFEAVRRAYLDDLVFKEGVSELPAPLARRIRPTPEVASRGFLRSVLNQTGFAIVGSCLALDIGGATTDLHYTVELVAPDSPAKPSSGVSVARFVFTDLGIVASRETLMLQLRNHPKLYEFLAAAVGARGPEVYAALREGEYEPSPALLSYACLFLALDRFAAGRGPGLPVGRLDMLAQVILTGGAAQTLDEQVVTRVVRLLLAQDTPTPLVQIDRRYEIWVAGITWSDDGQR